MDPDSLLFHQTHTGALLGLGVTRRLVQIYGGAIEVGSAVDTGTAFKVTFLGMKPSG